ncbi:MAG: ABC transporter ATP-binding protein [Fusobacteriaceae bacterium]
MIKVENLKYSIDEKRILNDISILVKKKKFVGIIGANGCGKSTLLKNIYRFLKCNSGEIVIDKIEISEYKTELLAKKMAVLAQKHNMNFDFTVEEIVEMGRYAHQKLEPKSKVSNKDIIEKSLKSVGMEKMKKRSFLSLSGGEMQRVLISRAIAQESHILILDEPTNHLDIKYQREVMEMMVGTDKTILAVIHDMNIASSYCDYIYAMKDGKIEVEGDPQSIFTKENIKRIFDVDCEVLKHPKRDRPLIIF